MMLAFSWAQHSQTSPSMPTTPWQILCTPLWRMFQAISTPGPSGLDLSTQFAIRHIVAAAGLSLPPRCSVIASPLPPERNHQCFQPRTWSVATRVTWAARGAGWHQLGPTSHKQVLSLTHATHTRLAVARLLHAEHLASTVSPSLEPKQRARMQSTVLPTCKRICLPMVPFKLPSRFTKALCPTSPAYTPSTSGSSCLRVVTL